MNTKGGKKFPLTIFDKSDWALSYNKSNRKGTDEGPKNRRQKVKAVNLRALSGLRQRFREISMLSPRRNFGPSRLNKARRREFHDYHQKKRQSE